MTRQFNLDADRTATRQVKNALELAVHDVVLALDKSKLAQGEIVFDQEQARETLKLSLENNLRLGSGHGFVYSPKSTSFFQDDDFYIVHLEFTDERNYTFP